MPSMPVLESRFMPRGESEVDEYQGARPCAIAQAGHSSQVVKAGSPQPQVAEAEG